MTTVDVIIPTLNRADLLQHCLQHLANSSYTDCQPIVYDDGSTDDIRPVVNEYFPSATIVRSEVNRGLAYGFNRCIDASTSPLVVLLNNDVEVTSDWLAELVACAERHPEAGSVASKIRLFDDRTRFHSAGDYYSCRGVAGNRGVWLEDLGQCDAEAPVFGPCGAAALYRRSALEAIRDQSGAVFDERLFMYYEDVDVAWRLQCAGYASVFAPRALVYHRLSATGGGTLASYHVARNALRVLKLTVPTEIAACHRARMLSHHLGRFAATLPHLTESAARSTLKGMLVGVLKGPRPRSTQNTLTNAELKRLESLLSDHQTERFHGIPVARLRKARAASGIVTARVKQPGRPDSA